MTAPPAPIFVTPAGVEVAAGLAQVHALAFDTPWTEAQLVASLAAPFAFALQARSAGRGSAPLGFILAQAVGEDAEVLTLAVAPAARRRGVARALVEATAGAALAAGARMLWLEVAEDNAAARGLYEGAGFRLEGRRRGYYRRPGGAEDALMLRRRLNSATA